MKLRLVIVAAVLLVLGALGWGALRFSDMMKTEARSEIPSSRVRKGKVTVTVSARGELQGGNSEVLTAPQAGGGDMPITFLREPGERVSPGDTVIEFDTTQQDYNLREAQADLAEAQQQVIKAQADGEAALEEARFAVVSGGLDVQIAELEVRKNPILAAIPARQNEIALEAAKNKEKQAQKDLSNRQASNGAGVAIQTAAVQKATVTAQNAQRIIDSLTVKAKTGGYVNVQQNSNQNVLYYGQSLPLFQPGDSARAGMAVAQIPDMHNWEVSTSIPELDRGHLDVGQKVSVTTAAFAGRSFKGHVKSLGGTNGPTWDRRFECRIALDETGPELRPGMTSNILITVESLDDVLWVPSQALFENDGRAFVYLNTSQGYTAHDVKLVRRSESQAVITGVKEGDLVALSSPDQSKSNGKDQSGGVMKALTK